MGKLKKAEEGVKKQRKILGDESYREKVKEELQEAERRKLSDFEAEMRSYEESIQQFEVLKLE